MWTMVAIAYIAMTKDAIQKISIMRARGSKTFNGRQLTIGLDLGDRSSCYCVLNEGGAVILEHSLPRQRTP